jgi:hypothetical protein
MFMLCRLLIVILPLRHHTRFREGNQVWEGQLAKKSKKRALELEEARPHVGELNLSACEARRLSTTCVESLELCAHVSGRIDPEAGYMVAHARDEVMHGIFDVRS